ncbi:hypothetical protein B6I21_02425 [candidate division KSB1 bacterium 4572_119]|nr:MAG: hypothetical protein B6I21_02425 [candidate division KSB1 bacterium 4572_119]
MWLTPAPRALFICSGGKNRVRVHIHTNHPEQVFAKLTPFGTISSQKIDDMWQQHSEKFSGKMVGKIGIVTDSSCDLPFDFIEENHINIIPVKIVFGNKAYLDKVDLSPVEFYNKLTKAAIHPKTSQPAMADIKKTYDRVAPFYEKIISIHLPRAVSGTLQSIERAAELFGDNKITSVDSKTISGALGLVVMEAAAAVKQELPFNRVIEKIQYAIENIHIYVSLPTLKYLVKGGRISASKGVIGKILNLNPIITFDEEGKVKLADKAIGQKSARQKTFNLISQKAKPYKRYKFIVAHANAPEKARWYLNQLKNHFKITEEIPVVDAAPALGVHTGPGTAGIAFIGYYD